MKNILAAIDFSVVTPRVLALSTDLAQRFGAKLWIIHIAAPEPDFIGFKTGPQHIRDQRAQELRQEHSEVQAFAAQAQTLGIDSSALLVQGPTSETLISEMERLQADLVVVGSHGRSALYRAFVGSVSEQLLRECRVPIVVVPSRDLESV